jgi:SET domain-containing protein
LQELPSICVDGKDNFHPSEKGRWLNHGYTPDNIPRIRHGPICDSDVNEISTFTDNKNGTNKPYLFQNRANTEYYVTRQNNFPICYIRAIRDIEKGEELFVDYGDQYWS